jgi:DNA-binding CsgD family transcriptional regulator/tetratricopeptide (TPR) repeat protein
VSLLGRRDTGHMPGWSVGWSRDWEDTYHDLGAAVADREPSADDLDRLATAAYLTGRDEQGFSLWERAHRARLDAGDIPGAATFGIRLAECLGFKGDLARARGWVDRTRHLLDEAQVDCVEQGYLDHAAAVCRIFESGDVPAAHALFVRAMKTSARFEDRELATLARIGLGRCLIYLGDVPEGLSRLDEAMVAVEAREISPVAVGDCYCTVIDACHELFDVQRLEAWTESFARWFRSQAGLTLYGGHCALHRADLLLLRGDWGAALIEAERAISRLTEPRNFLALGGAYYVRAELRRVRGEFGAADDDYRCAHERGCEPHPGLALLRFAQGRTDVAEASIRRLEAEAEGPVSRARMLGAFSAIVLAAGDVAAAGAAADELVALAQDGGSHYLTGVACHARGAVLLAAGEARQALVLLRRAARLWSELRTPYEGARTRVLLARACRALGDRETAELELDAARTTFLQLGARPDAAQVDRGGTPAPARAPGALSAREVEVLVRISRGDTNRAIARDLAISERTVASHVSHIFTKLGLASRAAATAYAYEHGLRDRGRDAVHLQ